MLDQLNSAATRWRPSWPIAAARAGSLTRDVIAAASICGSPGGTSRPVWASATTSGMPPTLDATTAVPQAIASRFTMPSGSYSDGHANTVAWLRTWMISALGSISFSQITPDRVSRR